MSDIENEPTGDDDLVARLSDLDEDLALQRANALRSGLQEYELDESDLDLLDIAGEDVEGITYLPALPVLARTYWRQALGVLVALIVLRRLLARRSR